MKIVLINPLNPDPPPAYYGPSYGLSLLGAIMKRRGHQVEGLDFDRHTRDKMLDAVPGMFSRSKPDLIGISCMSPNRGDVAALVERIKKRDPRATVVLGGPFVTQEPELMLRRCPADFAVIGDGEETLPELVEALESGRSPAKVTGLVYRGGNRLRRTADRGPFNELDSLPYPDFDLFDAAGALARHRKPEANKLAGPVSTARRRCLAMHSALMVLGSRGCVYRCVYCPMSMSGGKPRQHSPEYFLDFVGHLSRRYGQREFVFGDNHFTWDRDWVEAVCTGLIRRKLGLDWICMTRADRVDEELLVLMRAAGCREISYGIESGSPAIQRGIGKKLRLDCVQGAFEATRKAGISSTMMLMVGNPGDNRRTVRESAAFVRDMEVDRILVHTTKVYPGTRLHELAVERGVIPKGYYEGDNHHPPPYTGDMSKEELYALRAMLQPRTSYIPAGAGCNNGCCALATAAAGYDAAFLRRALALAALRAESVVLGGGEVLLRPDLRELLRVADNVELRNLRFYTNARLLAYEDRVKILRGCAAVHMIEVPVFSPQAVVHDGYCRVPGAFGQTVLGLRQWRRTGGEVSFTAFIERSFIGRGREWVRWMEDVGARRVVFVYRRSPSGWGRIPWENLPRLGEIADDLRGAGEEAVRAGIDIAVFGVPECVVSDAEVPHYESRFLFDEMILPSCEPVSLGRRRRERQRERPKACASCPDRSLCEGVWKGYLSRHGEREFHAR